MRKQARGGRQSWSAWRIGLLAVLAGGTVWAQTPQSGATQKPPAVDPQARALLQNMSDFLGNQQEFSVQADGSTEVVLKSGEKVQYDHSNSVRIRRPDRLRSDRRGELTDLEFYYDGRTFTLFGKNKNFYATAVAPPTLDQALDAAREKLGIEAPAADLLYSKPYEVLMEDVVSGAYVGKSSIHGQPCHHLAFRGNQTDWQIWIEDSPTPVPHKFVIASKKVKEVPEYSVELSQWNFSPNLTDAEFQFTPPPGSSRIDFLPDLAGRRGARGVGK